MRPRPTRTRAGTVTAIRGSRRRSALRFGDTAGRTRSRMATRCWLIGPAGPWSVASDWRSDWIGPGVARLLAARGRRVTLAVNAPSPGSLLQQYVRDALVRSLVREGKTHQIRNILAAGRSEGMCTLETWLNHLVANGLITYEEALSRSSHPKEIVPARGAVPNPAAMVAT